MSICHHAPCTSAHPGLAPHGPSCIWGRSRGTPHADAAPAQALACIATDPPPPPAADYPCSPCLTASVASKQDRAPGLPQVQGKPSCLPATSQNCPKPDAPDTDSLPVPSLLRHQRQPTAAFCVAPRTWGRPPVWPAGKGQSTGRPHRLKLGPGRRLRAWLIWDPA